MQAVVRSVVAKNGPHRRRKPVLLLGGDRAEAGQWGSYVQPQGQLLPAFVDHALDPSAG